MSRLNILLGVLATILMVSLVVLLFNRAADLVFLLLSILDYHRGLGLWLLLLLAVVASGVSLVVKRWRRRNAASIPR
jgi:hypothetical protein